MMPHSPEPMKSSATNSMLKWGNAADFFLIGAPVILVSCMLVGDLAAGLMLFIPLFFAGLLCGGMEQTYAPQGQAEELVEPDEQAISLLNEDVSR